MRVVIADDLKTPRLILRRIVTQDLGFEVVGEADDGAPAIEMCRQHKPDIAILDVSMPIMSGGMAAKVIIAEGLAKFVFIASSAAQDAIMKPLEDIGCIRVNKPFTTEKLVKEILAAIGG